MSSEILAFRKAAADLVPIYHRIDKARYNAYLMSREQRNKVATALASLQKAGVLLDDVADEIEEDVWGKTG